MSSSATSDWYDRLKRTMTTTTVSILKPAKVDDDPMTRELKEIEGESSFRPSRDNQIERFDFCQADFKTQLREWLSRMHEERNPFAHYTNEEEETAELSKKARPEDPYHDFCWDTRAEFPEFSWSGRRDRKGRFTGEGTLTFLESGDEICGCFRGGQRQGRGLVSTASKQLTGEFKDNLLTGWGRSVNAITGEVTEGFFKGSCLHGRFRKFGIDGKLTFVGRCRSGVPTGFCWRVLEGGGMICGLVNRKGELSGEELAFLFPDFSTCLFGCFHHCVMVRAEETFLEGCRDESGGGILALTWNKNKKQHHAFGLEDRKYDALCSFPLERDPYESITVECRNSLVPGANDGLFLLRDVSPGTVLAFYNGVRLPGDSSDAGDSWEDCAYRIFIDPEESDERVDMPREFLSLDVYRATLAHKVNHSFTPNCHFEVFEHPRFGRIPSVVASLELKKGEELFANYRYALCECPEWYSDLWESFGK